MFDLMIIGGGAAGMSCALILGSAYKKPYANNKQIGIFANQKSSHLQNAQFNNVLGVQSGTTGASILESGKKQLRDLYPHIIQIEKEKVIKLTKKSEVFQITTTKAIYKTKIVVVAVGYTNLINIIGLEKYIKPHPRSAPSKNRVYLENTDHLITKNLYVIGTLAGWRSQFAIASGSGAHVATDILTLWNEGNHTKVHDKV